MPIDRHTRNLAKRVDPGYIHQPHGLRRFRRGLNYLAGIVAVLWTGWYAMSDDRRLYNPGPVSAAHARFENDCNACHAGGGGEHFFQPVTDAACLHCHDGAIHHENQLRLVSTSAGQKTAGDCRSCHAEHRGRAALASIDDAQCLQCHADLKSNTANAKLEIRSDITGFSTAAHPTFGRRLRGAQSAWVDPTVLKFNHAKHMPLEGIDNNCTQCHAPTQAERRYMQPVNYQAHCMSCHQLELEIGGPRVAHVELELVRAQLADVASLYARHLDADPKKADRLKKEIKTGKPPRQKTEIVTVTEEQWVSEQVEKLIGQTGKSIPASDLPQAARLERHVAFATQNSCNYCHEVQGETALKTVPTQITRLPRRWFANSRFDHDAHRDLSCLSCHQQAATSAATSELLLPDIQSCVGCHHRDTPEFRGAGVDCVSCHHFHDRTHERAPVSGASLAHLLSKARGAATRPAAQ